MCCFLFSLLIFASARLRYISPNTSIHTFSNIKIKLHKLVTRYVLQWFNFQYHLESSSVLHMVSRSISLLGQQIWPSIFAFVADFAVFSFFFFSFSFGFWFPSEKNQRIMFASTIAVDEYMYKFLKNLRFVFKNYSRKWNLYKMISCTSADKLHYKKWIVINESKWNIPHTANSS